MSGLHALLIDPQNDFCDLPPSYWAPAPGAAQPAALAPTLPVTGAHADMQRLAKFIQAAKDCISDITVTLDSHQGYSIERPAMWMQADGSAMPGFTQVLAQDLLAGRYRLRHPQYQQAVLAYLHELERQGRFTHMVWPAHCEVATWGHAVHADVYQAYHAWEKAAGKAVVKVAKGTHPLTEHYSAIVAEVPDPQDASTQLNQALLDSLDAAQCVVVGGEAASHCVRFTLEHIVQYGRDRSLERYVLLEDCTSTIAGFEASYHEFLGWAQQQGLRISTSTQFLSELAPA